MADFGAELRAIDGGCLLEDLGEVLQEIRAKAYRVAEQEGEATGTITIKLKVKATREHKGKGDYVIPVRLRYAVDSQKGTIAWTVYLHAAERVIEQALLDAFRFAGERTGLPLYLGEPEAAPQSA